MSLPRQLCRHPDAAYKLVDGEALIVVSGSTAVHHVLNGVGARIWELLDGEHDFDTIYKLLAEEYDVDDAVAAKDLREFLQMLNDNGMLAETQVREGLGV